MDTAHTIGARAAAGSSYAVPNVMRHGFDPEVMALLGLSRFDGIGFKTLRRLGGRDDIRRLLELRDALEFDRAISNAGGKFSLVAAGGDWSALRHNIWRRATELASELAALNVGCLFEGDRNYPQALLDIPARSRPHWIFYRGDLSLLDQACLTIVGTREPSDGGEFLARYAVGCARVLGAPVISGLARGIDKVVHEWCLKLRLPTVSVMGTGILSIYPAKHAGLGDEILKAGGLLLSEYLPDQGVSAENFVQRNRLQAALGRAVIPAEWASKSGTAHTVRFARDLERPVFSISLSGVLRTPDAGEGDKHFSLPHDHEAFMQSLNMATEVGRPAAPEPTQYGFTFGDAQ
ncbi:DNA-processing protein DprA [Acidisphaera sp. S103]|uniref:DNA-processing protein DprA n=1 Tax=Acidisphaera sp. S103 TaxID=1747223 RepID=UPI00131D6470|nr:DNA-processing protein DprA [Acidisphaera sp. S103]